MEGAQQRKLKGEQDSEDSGIQANKNMEEPRYNEKNKAEDTSHARIRSYFQYSCMPLVLDNKKRQTRIKLMHRIQERLATTVRKSAEILHPHN